MNGGRCRRCAFPDQVERRLCIDCVMDEQDQITALAVKAGLVIPCDTCGGFNVHVYPDVAYVQAYRGESVLDPNPTHDCIPAPVEASP